MRTLVMAIGLMAAILGLFIAAIIYTNHRQDQAAAEYERNKEIEAPAN